jgi:regulator of RNase E activity RraA
VSALELTDALVERFARVKVADLADGCRRLRRRGRVAGPELRPGVPYQRLCGIAVTVRMAIEPGTRSYTDQVIELYERGGSARRAILVQQNDVPDFTSIGSGGARVAAAHGYTGWVTSGPIRDTDELVAAPIPVYGVGVRPSGRLVTDVPPGESFAFAFDSQVAIAGITVRPGDLVVADNDGLIALAPEEAEAVLAEAEAILADEDRVYEALERGVRARELFGAAPEG